MNSKIDTKSILIGLLAGVAVTLVVGAAIPTNQVGRYQIAGAGNHAVIVDTVTGQVWQGYMPSMEGSTDADFFKVKVEGKK
jgi:hypothetical protein